MKKQIKELRIKIDGLAQLTKGLKPITQKEATESYKGEIWDFKKEGTERVDTGWRDDNSIKVNSKEIDKSVDSLYFAKAWLGKLLGELGVESPYPKDGTRKTVDDIEPTADKQSFLRNEKDDFKTTIKEFKNKNHIEKVDWLRQEIQKLILDVENLDLNFSQHQSQRPSREFAIARTNAYSYLCEARFWLGFELGRIKENK